jgi:hypothetical protein
VAVSGQTVWQDVEGDVDGMGEMGPGTAPEGPVSAG